MTEPQVALERELPRRVVVVGDLNGQGGLLARMLRGLRLIDAAGHWRGGRTVLVQLGDLVNRGPGSRYAMDLLVGLGHEARGAGGDVVWLLGNHEVLTALRHHAYVTAEEYLEFATPSELEEFHHARTRFQYQLLGMPRIDGRVPPVGGILRAWEEVNAPGVEAFVEAMGPAGRFGRAIRRLPVAVRIGPLLLVHGGLSPRWAELGLPGMHKVLRKAWGDRPASYDALDPHSLLRDPLGPVWNRVYCISSNRKVGADLNHALARVGAAQMIVGHTRTDAAVAGRPGHPLARFGGRLVMADVGLGDPGEPGTVLVIEKKKIEAWSPGGARSLVTAVRRST